MKKLLFCSTLLFSGALQSSQQIPVPITNQFTLGYGGKFTQSLSVTPQQVQAPSPGWTYGTEGTYTLTFSVLNYYPSYPGYYIVEIDYGTQELCEASGWGVYHWSQVTVTCPSPNYLILDKSLPGGGPVQGADNLVLHFTVNDGSSNGGWPIIFDKVSLNFAPEIP